MVVQEIPVATAMTTGSMITSTPSVQVAEQLLSASYVSKKASANSDVTQAWFTTRFDKVAMQSKGRSVLFNIFTK